MKKHFLFKIAILLLLSLSASCNFTSKLYTSNNNNRVTTGQVSESEFKNLHQILDGYTSTPLNDTILIKYDYNNENCWNNLDLMNKDYIMQVVNQRKQRLQNILDTRKNVSAFNFREPGKNVNKLKKLDNSILIDIDKKLLQLLFTERTKCGNSMVIMPDKQYIFIRSDAHSDILDLTQKQFIGILNNN